MHWQEVCGDGDESFDLLFNREVQVPSGSVLAGSGVEESMARRDEAEGWDKGFGGCCVIC